jgi:serine/threonine protein kinase
LRLLQLASALVHVHALGIAHLDVKPANVLLAADGSIRLADFGVASRVPARRRRGTPLFVAPEILSTGVAGTAADAWSFGVVVYTLLVGFPPFFLHDDKDDPAELDEQVRLCSPRTLASAALALSRAVRLPLGGCRNCGGGASKWCDGVAVVRGTAWRCARR